MNNSNGKIILKIFKNAVFCLVYIYYYFVQYGFLVSELTKNIDNI